MPKHGRIKMLGQWLALGPVVGAVQHTVGLLNSKSKSSFDFSVQCSSVPFAYPFVSGCCIESLYNISWVDAGGGFLRNAKSWGFA